jgi:hypothetical protein
LRYAAAEIAALLFRRLTSKIAGEIAMNTIVANVLRRGAEKQKIDARPLRIVPLFCCVGLLASLCMASLGVDVSAGFL